MPLKFLKRRGKVTLMGFFVPRFQSEVQHKPSEVPTSTSLLSNDMQQEIVRRVSEKLTGPQQSLLEEEEGIEIATVVNKATKIMVQQTIDIPRVVVVPTGEVTHGYHPFTLDMSHLNLQLTDRELISQSLQTNQQISISAQPNKKYSRLEDYIVEHLDIMF